jgi:NADPH:quinone reductase
VMSKPAVTRKLGAELDKLAHEGHISPIVGARFALEDASQALRLIDGRGATGKVVLEL